MGELPVSVRYLIKGVLNESDKIYIKLILTNIEPYDIKYFWYNLQVIKSVNYQGMLF